MFFTKRESEYLKLKRSSEILTSYYGAIARRTSAGGGPSGSPWRSCQTDMPTLRGIGDWGDDQKNQEISTATQRNSLTSWQTDILVEYNYSLKEQLDHLVTKLNLSKWNPFWRTSMKGDTTNENDFDEMERWVAKICREVEETLIGLEVFIEGNAQWCDCQKTPKYLESFFRTSLNLFGTKFRV